MPSAPLKLCVGRCGARVPAGLCDDCRKRRDQARLSSNARLYDWKWRAYSKRRLRKHPLCAICEADGRTTAATMTDHKVAHKGDKRLFWDPANHQSSCGPCNSRKAARDEGGFGNAIRR